MPEAPKSDIPEEHVRALQFIQDVTENADVVQRRVLEEILTQNAPAEYLHRHGLSACTAPNLDAFKKLMPIVSYEDIQSDILRIAHGDASPILSGRPVSEFLTRYIYTHKTTENFGIFQRLISSGIYYSVNG
jgi:auxin responsive GH3 gene family